MKGGSATPVVVVGAGYVGLVTAVGLAELGHHVHLAETSPTRLATLREGRVPIPEPGLQDGLKRALDAGRLTVAVTPPETFNIALVCVGTPIDADGKSDLRQIRAA